MKDTASELMGVINATIAGGTRRMLQDVLAWNHARSTDIQRLNAMAASGLVPKDSQGNLQIPPDVLDGLWRPFPGSPPSMTSITALGGDGQQQPSGGGSAAPANTTSPPTAAGQADSGKPLPWGKIGAAILAAALGSGGVGAGIVSWLGSGGGTTPPAATTSTGTTPPTKGARAPGYQVNETQYELRFGKLKGAK